ncbi:MAG: hypothetical protein ACI8VC_000504 [Candidatus Endobugula sp.]|jgi:hypothetical protein
MLFVRVFLVVILGVLVGCVSVNKDYASVDKKTAAEVEIVAPIGRRVSAQASVCQPGRQGKINGSQSLYVEPGVTTLISVSERRQKPGAIVRICKMNVLFTPSPLKKYYIDVHALGDKCYLSVDHDGAAFITSNRDLMYEMLVKKNKKVSCRDVVAGNVSAENIDESIEKYEKREQQYKILKQEKRDKDAAELVIKNFGLTLSGGFVRNGNAFEKIEKNGVVYYADSFLEVFKAPYYISVTRKDKSPMSLQEAEDIAVPYIKPKGCTSPIVRKQELDRYTEDKTRWLIGVEC